MHIPNTTAGQLRGIYAALPTPFGDDGQPDLEALDPVVDFLIDSEISGLCVGGATGEYPACGLAERELIFRRVAFRTNGRVPLIFGVGAGNAAQIGRLAQVARECGASAVLLPPPFYFRYGPDEVAEFTRELGSSLPLPVLIYYIPQFTNPFDLGDALQLIETVPNIVGIKDSSGRSENVPSIAKARSKTPLIYFSGDDSCLIDAYQHGADGAISGVASACPELLLEIEKFHRNGAANYPEPIQNLLNEFIAQICALPTPWGVKLALEVRGFRMGPVSWTGCPQIESRVAAFREWFDGWLRGYLNACSSHDVSQENKL
ncbi:MAG TPA: dihydrodipicolinate synthase family protein [Terriglobia bacterium]|nr:dihydrodipicolinate synthase family protein [Terriglobia bacterium]